MANVQTILLTSTALITFLIGTAWAMQAQAQTANTNANTEVRTSVDCDNADDHCNPETRNNDTSVIKEIDKATPAAASATNICDGVTCPDGSCATVASECRPVSIGEPARTVSPDIFDASDIDHESQTERPNEPLRDRAQNHHNSSRSNRTDGVAAPDYNDPDDDGDGIPTRIGGELDKASAKLFESFRRDLDSDADGIGDLDSDGMPDVAARTRAFMKLDDIKGEVRVNTETGEPRLSRVAVAARDLRNWTNEDREAFTRLREAVASNTPEAASLRVTERMLADDRIEEIEATETETRVRYRANLRLFGFIPVEREVEARADATGEVRIEYPWYQFFSTTPDSTAINNLMSDIRTHIGGGGAGKVSL